MNTELLNAIREFRLAKEKIVRELNQNGEESTARAISRGFIQLESEISGVEYLEIYRGRDPRVPGFEEVQRKASDFPSEEVIHGPSIRLGADTSLMKDAHSPEMMGSVPSISGCGAQKPPHGVLPEGYDFASDA